MGTSLAAESLLSLAVTATSEQCVESVLQSIVQGLAAQPGMALARIWLRPSVGLPSHERRETDTRTRAQQRKRTVHVPSRRKVPARVYPESSESGILPVNAL